MARKKSPSKTKPEPGSQATQKPKSKSRHKIKTRSKPAFDLRPFATTIQPGTVLYLNKDITSQQLRSHTNLNEQALGHPCVIISQPQDNDNVTILLMSTFGGKSIHEHIKAEYIKEYLPISPTADIPTYPGIQLRLLWAPNKAGGYVNVKKPYIVPWAMLTKWVKDQPVDKVQFDVPSIKHILNFMGSMMSGSPIPSVSSTADNAERRISPYASRLIRPNRKNLYDNPNFIPIPFSKIRFGSPEPIWEDAIDWKAVERLEQLVDTSDDMERVLMEELEMRATWNAAMLYVIAAAILVAIAVWILKK